MLVVRYDSQGRGTAIPDAGVENYIMSHMPRRGASRNASIDVSTENIVLAIRTMVAEGRIETDRVRIVWNGRDLIMDEQGRFLNWSNSLYSLTDNHLERLQIARSAIRGVE